MGEKSFAEMLAAHADGLIGHREAMQASDLTTGEHGQLAPLFQLAGRLQQAMQPVRPSRAFVCNLRRDLASSAERQVAMAKRLRLTLMIGAAALGSLVSVASVVGAIVFVVLRLRARAQTQVVRVTTG